MNSDLFDLPRIFQAVTAALILQQEALNQADPYNRDHGDHMVEIFDLATRAATIQRSAGLGEAMAYASQLLRERPENGSALVYARGLSHFAEQFRQRQVGLEDLVPYARRMLAGEENQAPAGQAKSGDVLKALLTALAGWEQEEAGYRAADPGKEPGFSGDQTRSGLDLGTLFGVGMTYLQAKQKGGDRVDILVETVVNASPLSQVPYRAQSGKIALKALLEAMGSLPDGGSAA